MNEEDILANLEESLEQHNYETAGFVSSYALPLSHDTTNDEEVVLSQPIKFTRAVESFESANNSSVGTNDDDDETSNCFNLYGLDASSRYKIPVFGINYFV